MADSGVVLNIAAITGAQTHMSMLRHKIAACVWMSQLTSGIRCSDAADGEVSTRVAVARYAS
jgi:hypothetical protein